MMCNAYSRYDLSALAQELNFALLRFPQGFMWGRPFIYNIYLFNNLSKCNNLHPKFGRTIKHWRHI